MFKKFLPLALLALSGVVNADNYAGIGLGQAKAEVEAIALPGYVSYASDTGTAVKFLGGFEVGRNFAVEVGFASFGEMGVDYLDGFDTIYESAETSAVYIAAVGSIPLGQASLFGKVGFASWYREYSVGDEIGVLWRETSEGVDPMVGLGLQLNAGSAFSLRAEVERFMDVGDRYTIGQSDVDVLSISGVLWY
jgi:OOP family OmpA-OmpF porin